MSFKYTLFVLAYISDIMITKQVPQCDSVCETTT